MHDLLYGSQLQAFRYVFLITVTLTIILVILDPFNATGASTGTVEQPWVSRWYIIALTAFLFFIGLCGRGRVAWVALILVLIFSAVFQVYLYFQNKRKVASARHGKSYC